MIDDLNKINIIIKDITISMNTAKSKEGLRKKFPCDLLGDRDKLKGCS